MAGVSRLQYTTEIKIIRVMCTGRIDLAFIFRAFSNGVDGVFIGGCWPGECHYITEGNYLALSLIHLGKKLLEKIGVNSERLRLDWISASEGSRFAEVVNDFVRKVKESGPLGQGEGISETELRFKLEAVKNLIPYLKLVEREKMRVRFKTTEEYNNFFNSAEFDRLFQELIADKLVQSQMMALLRERPLTASGISEILGLDQTEVSKHLHDSVKRGLVRFDESQNLIAAAEKESSAKGRKKENVRTAMNDEKIDSVINKHQGKAGSLIHALTEIQRENRWLPKEVLVKISKKLEVPLSRVMQIATFYKTFSLMPRGRHEVHVCTGSSCHVRGSQRLLDTVQGLIGIGAGQTDANSKFSLETGNCLGCCSLGPEIVVDGEHHARMNPDKARDVLKTYE